MYLLAFRTAPRVGVPVGKLGLTGAEKAGTFSIPAESVFPTRGGGTVVVFIFSGRGP